MTPSPQAAAFGSARQISEQPSPGFVLPSSHDSGPTTMWSPQIGTQRRPGTGQNQPSSTVEQSLAQPSAPAALPSSHASDGASRPSPHKLGTAQGPGGPQVPHSQ